MGEPSGVRVKQSPGPSPVWFAFVAVFWTFWLALESTSGARKPRISYIAQGRVHQLSYDAADAPLRETTATSNRNVQPTTHKARRRDGALF